MQVYLLYGIPWFHSSYYNTNCIKVLKTIQIGKKYSCELGGGCRSKICRGKNKNTELVKIYRTKACEI